MAIGEIFNTLTYGGINSGDYGIYITGEAVYNAPEKNVTVISVPGRNGDIVIDKGNFANIDVKYKAGTFGADQKDFRKRLGRFRNALKAKSGYQRVTDTYHPEQYRMAVFVDAFEVDADPGVAGEFELVFNSKPQRWLTDGETPVTVANGDTLTNPTLFPAEPLLAIKGSGLVKFNGYEINLINPYRGETVIAEPIMEQYGPLPYEVVTVTADLKDVANVGDTITVKPVTIMWDIILPSQGWPITDQYIRTISITETATKTTIMGRDPSPGGGLSYIVHMRTVIDEFEITRWPVGVNAEQIFEIELTINYRYDGAYTVTGSVYLPISYTYDETTGQMTFTFVGVEDEHQDVQQLAPMYARAISLSTQGMSVDSTVYLLGDPTYLDCELGEAYKIEDGEIVSLNNHIDMGSKLPRLVPGDTEFEISGDITECKVTPRWWEL